MLFLESCNSMYERSIKRNGRLSLQLLVRLWTVLSLASLAFMPMGCSGYSAAEHRVDAANAHDTLEKVLARWQQGDTTNDCLALSPPVVVQDMDWASGRKLQAFEIIGPGEARDANYYCEVRLSFEPSERVERGKTVTYLVGTSPVLTVFRSPGP